MVQVVTDSFDTDVSPQNGKLSTHSLAVVFLLVVPPAPDQAKEGTSDAIPWLKHHEVKEPIFLSL